MKKITTKKTMNPITPNGVRYEFLRLIKEVRPSWVIVENVARLCHTNDGSRVVADLAEAGYAWGTSLLGSEVVGTPHSRPRSWIVASDDYPYGDGDIDEGVEAGKIYDNLQRAFEENNKQGNYWKRQLGTGNDGKDGHPEQSESAAYSESVRRIHDDARWVDELRCCGNSVIWVIPAFIGAFIVGQGWDSRVRGGRYG